LHEVKGQRHLVEALRILVSGGADVICHLVGDGPGRGSLERQVAASGLKARVLLEGALTRSEIAALLADADVIVAPSVPTSAGKREGIPVALMEGMATGLPAVASRLSGIPELIEDGVSGLLVPPGNAPALATALGRLATNPELASRLGRAARLRILEDYDLRANAAKLVERFALGTGS